MLKAQPEVARLLEAIDNCSKDLGLDSHVAFYDFPVFRDEHDELLRSQIAIVGDRIGVLLLACTSGRSQNELIDINDRLDRVFSNFYSRALRTKSLQADRTTLAVPVNSAIFAPFLDNGVVLGDISSRVLRSAPHIRMYISSLLLKEPMGSEQLRDLQGTFVGTRGLVRQKARASASSISQNKLVAVLDQLESQMAAFDINQAEGYITQVDGPQRIRGLAGSGKTVVLAMKAALTHLRDPQAKILYTFHTKSLYQHVKRTITRFYREFDDRDPDWDRVIIQHSWGGSGSPGVYSSAASSIGVQSLNFRDASAASPNDPLGFACEQLLSTGRVQPLFDYCYIDEGQDFSAPFIRLCASLCRKNRFVLAYDELQNIFRTRTPTTNEIFGEDPATGMPLVDFAKETVLPVCYRNPREILVVAHAIGFGIYGNLVQMIEDSEYWETIGYEVIDGREFHAGTNVKVRRPERNSLPAVSDALSIDEIISNSKFETFADEVNHVAGEILKLIRDGIRPDDIAVVIVDDRSARRYLSALRLVLSQSGISVNDIHTDVFGVPDFTSTGSVTLTTVHKAKGNEAFVVFVLGVDAVFSGQPTVRDRNVLFTAITRAKGLVRISGVGESAAKLFAEIDLAKRNYPDLVFVYPGPARLKQIRRDWDRDTAKKSKAQAEVERLLREHDPETLLEMLKQQAKARDNNIT